MKVARRSPSETPDAAEAPRRKPRPAAGVVYTAPPLALARVVGEEGGRFRVSVHGHEREAALDPSVDPRVLRAALESGARVVVEGGPVPVVVGALVTAPVLGEDREGNVRVEVERFEVHARTEALLKTPHAFVRLRGRLLEHYAAEVRVRGRDLVKVLAAVIGLN